MQGNPLSSFFIDEPQAIIERMIHNVEKVIVGKRDSIEMALTAFLCGGHILLEDVPGVGKTALVKALALTVGCTFSRIQFTPDLLPSDITGVSIYNQKTSDFEFRPGPLMANIVLADEINRTPPKTQSAMLEAMEERSMTVDGTTYKLPEPFIVLATQNPLEYEGTFVLPEAQMDRFMLKLELGYPAAADEADMLGRLQETHPLDRLRPVIAKEDLIGLQKQVRSVYVDGVVKEYIVALSEATRKHPEIALGASPRASIALFRAAQATAFLKGRTYVIPDDVKNMFGPVNAHRLIYTAQARMSGQREDRLIQAITQQVPVPNLRYVSGMGR